MEKVLNNYLVLTILILETSFLYTISLRSISATVNTFYNNNYFRVFKAQIIDNQVKIRKNPTQLHFYPIRQFTSESTFVESPGINKFQKKSQNNIK